MEQQAGHFAGLLNNHLRFLEAIGETLSQNIEQLTPFDLPGRGIAADLSGVQVDSETRELIGSTLSHDKAIHSVLVGTPGAGTVFSYNDKGLDENNWPGTALPPTKGNSWGWSRPFRCPLSGESIVTYQVPRMQNLYFSVKVQSFLELLQKDNPRQLRFVIVDRSSYFIHSDMRSTRPDMSLAATASRLNSDSLRHLVNGPIKEGRRGLETVFFRDWPTWYFASPVPQAGWMLLTHIRETYALGEARQSALYSAGLLLLALLLISAGVLKVSGFITRPLVRLALAVDGLGDGHWELPVQHDSKDETGRLARSISAMAQRLSERDDALKDLRASNISHMASRLRGRYFYYMLDDQGRINYISPSVSHILGFTPEDLLSQLFTFFTGSQSHRLIRPVIRDILKGGQQEDAIQVELPHKGGGFRTIEIINVPVVEPGGRVSGVEGMGHDVTQLVSDNKKFRGLLEAAPDAIVITDPDENIILVNARAEDMFGYRRQDLVGSPLSMLNKKHTGMLLSRPSGIGGEGLQQGSLQQGFETICRRQDASIFPAELTSNPLETDDGTLIMIAIRDITDRKHIERDLRQARDKARAADMAKSQFLSNMSHELRTPLNGILGHVQLLLRLEKLQPGQRESLETVEDCGKHLLVLINDVLDLTKIESTGAQVQFQPVRLRPVLDKACHILRPRSDRKGLKFELSVDENLPSVILMDATKLRQILINLLGNAIKFTDNGQVQLKVMQDGERIVYIVSDTGVGIEVDDQDKIFSPFHQVDFQGHPGGTGLGLAICQRLVSALGGALKVSSAPGCGSRFYFSLPLRRAVLNEDLEASANSLDACALQIPQGHNISVLIVDDSRINRELLVRLLASAGFETKEAVNGRDALNSIQTRQPDLILMDIRMPVMNGTDAVRQLRRNNNHVPVIAVTASVEPMQQERFKKAGFDDYVGKPFRVDELFLKIEKILHVHFQRLAGSGVGSTTDGRSSESTNLEELPVSALEIDPMIEALREAADVGDIDRVKAITRELQNHPACQGFVHRLEELCSTFSFDTLETICQEADNKRQQDKEIISAEFVSTRSGEGGDKRKKPES